MQPPRPTECHRPRRAATEAHNISVLRRPIGAVKGVPNSEMDPSCGRCRAFGSTHTLIGSANGWVSMDAAHQRERHKMQN
jgi:hypothetical protein